MNYNDLNTKFIKSIISGIILLVILGDNLYKYITTQELGFNELLSIPIALMFFLSAITWNLTEEQDELGRLITYKSAKVSYFILMIFIFITFIIVEYPTSEGYSLRNKPLFIVLCVSTMILPLMEFIISRRYR